jgi:hypothetical protein
MSTYTRRQALRDTQAFAAHHSSITVASAQIRMMLAAAVLCAGTFMQLAYAADAQPPRVTGSDIKADGKISNVKASGISSQSAGGGLSIGYGRFSLGGSGSKASGALDAAVSSGVAVVNGGARVTGSDITAHGAVTNSITSGATLRAGVATVGSN